jgi:hypothetical protein
MLFIALNSLNMSLDCKQVQPSVEIEANIKSKQKIVTKDIYLLIHLFIDT